MAAQSLSTCISWEAPGGTKVVLVAPGLAGGGAEGIGERLGGGYGSGGEAGAGGGVGGGGGNGRPSGAGSN